MAKHPAQRVLFNPFPGTTYLSRGGYGHIFRLPADSAIVVKISYRIINGTAAQERDAVESSNILKRERAVYEALAARPQHPAIVE